MMNKIRDLIAKLTGKKSSPDEEYLDDREVQIEVDEDGYVYEYEVVEEGNAIEDETPPQAPVEEHTEEVPVFNQQANEEVPPSVEQEQSLEDVAEVETYEGEDATGDVDTLYLDDAKIGLKDKITMAIRALKDKVNRLNANKFKSPELPSTPSSEISKASVLGSLEKIFLNLDTRELRAIPARLFSPSSRNQIHKYFQYTIIFGTVFILGKNLAIFLKGEDTTDSLGKSSSTRIDSSNLLTRMDINTIKNSGIFKTEDAASAGDDTKPVIQENIICKTANKKSSLPIKLVNTVVLQDSVKSIASVSVRSGAKIEEVREGDKINGMAKVDAIDRQKIIVKNLQDGSCEMIENQDPSLGSSRISVMTPSQSKTFSKRKKKLDGIENEGNQYTIEKSFIQDKMKNISDILTQARGVQITNPDGTLSFKIVDVQPGGVFSYLGIQNNDIITKINGKKISNLNEVMGLFGGISNVQSMKITINRDGQEVPLDYKIR